ncbi:WW domain binding protein 11-domain-containing protein [Whalleya microplaca]|nr:WW domain binding protein 11-domain-containing protein [Whalleya microplaca]
MAKERNFNPVQAQRKAEKAKAIKKGKSEAVNRRNEKLATRNPERIQKQIEDLKQITTNGGKLSKHEESVLEGLERDLKAVNKAREALGDRAPKFGRGGGFSGDGHGGNGVLGKRRRGGGGNDDDSSDGEVPDDVRNIPMPRDTPPPISKEEMDKWYAKRRAAASNPNHNPSNAPRNANDTPLGGQRGRGQETTPPVVVEAKTVYEAKPIVRDLRKEAVSAFVPTAVRMKLDKGKGRGGLMEPEEADQLEREGYLRTAASGGGDGASQQAPRGVTVEEVEEGSD